MKTLNQIKIICAMAGCCLASSLYAQSIATNVDWNTASDDQVILQAIELTTPTPSNAVPAFATFYSAQHSPISSQPWPPLPGNPDDFSAWNLGSNVWVLDDLGFNYNTPSIQVGHSMMAMDAGGISPPGSDGTNIFFPAGNFVAFDPGTNLWIAQEAVSGGNFTGILSNTIAGVEYQLLSMNSLNSGQWAYQGEPLLAYTNWVAWSLPFDPTTNFFLNALSFQDDSGTGIPDWWWLKYFGQDTNGDPYADPIGDGWTLQQDFENGLSPTSWNTPPAPQGLAVNSFNSASDTATLSWLPSPGPVTGYTIQTPTGTFNIGNVTSYIDNESFIYATYSVEADYAGGPSAWSDSVSVQQSGLSANIIAGPQGSAYLAVSGLPANTYELEVTRIDEVATSEFGDSSYNVTNYIAVTNATNGFYPLANVMVSPDTYVQEQPYAQYGIYFQSTENWYVQAIETNGLPNYPVFAGSSYTSAADDYQSSWTVPPYFDGREQLKQNLIFLLRDAGEQPFSYATYSVYEDADIPWQGIANYSLQPSNYAYAGFYDTESVWSGHAMSTGTNGLDYCRPFYENYLYANFIFTLDDINPTGLYGEIVAVTNSIGQSYSFNNYNGIPTGDPNCLLLTNAPPSLFQPPTTQGVSIAPQLNDPQWLYTYQYIFALQDYSNGVFYDTLDAGFTYTLNQDGSATVTMANNPVNYFGIPIQSAEAVYYDEANNLQVQSESPGASFTGYPYFAFPQTTQPEFQPVEYDFWNTSSDALPGSSNFSPTNTGSQPLIVGVGSPASVACYAKLAVENGNPGLYGFIGQYFTNAYEIDASGNITTNTTGILSPYGAFFPTQPGPAALKTMPDIDTGLQGTGVVYCVSLNVDKNHDGTMDTTFTGADTTSKNSPMEFWINNDNDGTGIGNDINAPTLPDSASDVIQSLRGLEDFARLWICGLPALPYNYQVTLSWTNISSGNPSIKIFPSQETNGGTEYLTDTNVAQNYVGNPLTEPCYGTVTNGQNFQFPDLYFTEGGNKYLIFEGVTAGTGELILTVADNNGNTIAKTGVWLDLHDIKDLYELAEATNVTSGLPPSTLVSQLNVVRAVPPSQNETKQVVVFVHGINNTSFDAQSSTETLYKRLYWSGYHGKVAEFKWPCAFLPFDNTLNPFNYNLGEFYAWKSASALVDYLTYLRNRPDLAGYDIDILAHSQGNVVASEAVRLGAPFDNYILTQGAIPAHCYDTSVPFLQSLLNAESNSPTPFYTTNGGYNGYFSSVTGNLVNFYNTNDYALATGTWNGLQANWVADQISQKPEDYTYRAGQSYAYYPSSFRTIASYTFSDYDVTDPYEIMSQVARSRTSAVGAQANVAGVIDSAASVDLVAEFGFGNTRPEHSAEFTRPIQSVWGYYDAVLTAFKLQHVAR